MSLVLNLFKVTRQRTTIEPGLGFLTLCRHYGSDSFGHFVLGADWFGKASLKAMKLFYRLLLLC